MHLPRLPLRSPKPHLLQVAQVWSRGGCFAGRLFGVFGLALGWGILVFLADILVILVDQVA